MKKRPIESGMDYVTVHERPGTSDTDGWVCVADAGGFNVAIDSAFEPVLTTDECRTLADAMLQLCDRIDGKPASNHTKKKRSRK